MDITFLTEYTMPVVVGLCLCVGYIIKHWLKDADNKIIPTVVTVVGIAAAVAINWGNITIDVSFSTNSTEASDAITYSCTS